MTFKINGVDVVGVQCEWANVPIQQQVANTQTFSSFASHTWNVDVMLASLYTTLRTFRGLQVTLQTNSFTAFNTIDTVFGDAILEAIAGNQEGHLMSIITFAFRVNIT